MSQKLLAISDKKEWNDIIKKLPTEFQDIYLKPEYQNLYLKNNEGDPFCFYFYNNEGIGLYPFLLNNINKLGYNLDKNYYDAQSVYGYSGIVTTNKNKDFINKFYNNLKNFFINKNIIVNFIRFNPFNKNHELLSDYIDIKYNNDTVKINLKDQYDFIFNKIYSSNNRNMIRRGRDLFYSRISNDKKSLIDFKTNYIDTMNKLKTDKYYYFSDDYFLGLINDIKNYSFLVNIYRKSDHASAGSMILLKYKDYAHYHLSGRSVQITANCVTNFMLDEAVKYLKESNCIYFHLGGGRTSDEDDSLLKFKKNFSKEVMKFYIGKDIINEKIYNLVCSQWEKKYTDNSDKYKNYILKYRYT